MPRSPETAKIRAARQFCRPWLLEKPLAYCLLRAECRLNSTCLPQTVYYRGNDRNHPLPHSHAGEKLPRAFAERWRTYFRRTAGTRHFRPRKWFNASGPAVRSWFVIERSRERLEMPEQALIAALSTPIYNATTSVILQRERERERLYCFAWRLDKYSTLYAPRRRVMGNHVILSWNSCSSNLYQNFVLFFFGLFHVLYTQSSLLRLQSSSRWLFKLFFNRSIEKVWKESSSNHGSL